MSIFSVRGVDKCTEQPRSRTTHRLHGCFCDCGAEIMTLQISQPARSAHDMLAVTSEISPSWTSNP